MAHGRVEPIEGEEDAPAGLCEALEAGRVWPRERSQCVVTLQEMRHSARSPGHAALAQGRMDVGDTPVVSGAPRPKAGDNVAPTCVLGKGTSPCVFRAVGVTNVGTAPVETATH